jgi:general secretion pathway protein B
VPGLHAQPAPLAAADAPMPSRTPTWLWAVIGMTAGLVVALAWYFIVRDAPVSASAQTQALPAAAPTPAANPATSAASPIGARNTAPAASSMPPLMAEPAPWPSTDARKPAERAPDPPASRTDIKDAQPAASAATTAGASGTTPVVEPAAATSEQLPQHIRAQLPQLTFGGSIYSSNAASRSLIVNGRLHREADQVLPGLTLEQIKPNGAVFNFKGYRFEVLL